MTKKSFTFYVDKLFWVLVYSLPLIAFVVYMFATKGAITLSAFMTDIGLGILTDNVIYSALSGVFGAGGVLPLFASPDVLIFFTYFIAVFIVRLFVDFILFIPRLADRWLNKFESGGLF